MVVAVVIGFSDTHFYTWYAQAPRIFPLSEVEDQRLGALIMWVPGALVMWLGITYAYFRWSRPDSAEDEKNVRISPPPQNPVILGRPGGTRPSGSCRRLSTAGAAPTGVPPWRAAPAFRYPARDKRRRATAGSR